MDKMKKFNHFNDLTREDKWYLGGGNRLLWAPPFPLFLENPGFWDEAHYYNLKFQPLYTWTLLDENGMEIPLQFISRAWNPACLTQKYKMVNSKWPTVKRMFELDVIEYKAILDNDVAACYLRLINKSNQGVKLNHILWTIQESNPSKQSNWLTDIEFHNGIISFTKHLKTVGRPHFKFAAVLGLNRRVQSFSINLSEGSAIQPHWHLTPFFEKFSNRRLPNEKKLRGVNEDGLLYLALHTELLLQPESEETMSVGLAVAPTLTKAQQNLAPTMREENPIRLSERSWDAYFNQVPYFECSDEYLMRYYWYRWYGVRLNKIHGNEGNYKRPFVCEGIGYFRAPISYSASCHILENRWRHTPKLSQGSLLTFLDNQRTNGGLRGYIDLHHFRQEKFGVSGACTERSRSVEPFYHANWGQSVIQLHRVHPSVEFLESAYQGLKRYADYFDRERDKEGIGLYDIYNHYETGQEYMHRYLVVEPEADQKNWGKAFCLKGVDVTVYIYELKRALEKMAEKLEKKDKAVNWHQGAEKIKQAILQRMWDPKEEMFFDLDPKTEKRTLIKAAVCFYPYFTDIVGQAQIAGLKKHLFNPNEFWTPFPVPSSSVDDEYFSAEPEWKGKRMNCPWNGRVWPMTNSHIAEALAHTAIRFNDAELKEKTVEFITKFIKMMFFDRDPQRPNSFEHYHPMNGKPSLYRGIDDYQHSWVVNLIIKYVCGIRPEDDFVIIDPFPFEVETFLIDNVFVRGSILKVSRKGRTFSVWLNKKFVDKSIIGQAIEFSI